MIDISAKEAAACLDKWVKILRLQDWDIKLSVLNEAEYVLRNGAKSNAYVSMTYVKLSARIDINKVSDDDFEYCLVHELVHIVLGPAENYWEFAIDQCHATNELNAVRDHEIEIVTHRIARALLAAHYSEKKGK